MIVIIIILNFIVLLAINIFTSFINNMKIFNQIRTFAIASIAAVPLLTAPSIYAQNPKQDSFEYSIPPKGTDSELILANAPSPDIVIANENKKASIVIDLSKNVLYKYDDSGTPMRAYLVASGKKSTPTHPGVRIVTHIETYPYRYAPRASKRRQNPGAYGPKIICLNKIDSKTAEQSPTGEFIHGNNKASSIGQYASKGCIRMDNEVIKELSQQVRRGDIVIIQK